VSPSEENPQENVWRKYAGNPVLGGHLGTCFDMSVHVEGHRHRMWFSWRPKHGIGYAESEDGFHWQVQDEVVLGPDQAEPTECLEVTRPYVLVGDGGLTMWYAAHGDEQVVIARASSPDGLVWEREGTVLVPSLPWEKSAIMCPSVLRDTDGRYHMWYSGGERYEPDAIGYATSLDGYKWERVVEGPVLTSNPAAAWEHDRVAGAHVFRANDWLYAFYIGFANGFEESSIGVARSNDGVNWARHAGNPVLTKGPAGTFDSINVYKPFVIVDGRTWRVWYNGSSPLRGDDTSLDNRVEQIGYASAPFEFQAGTGGGQVDGLS
jgi:beta-1,2-mannobiose phosphorylase / 1,2-beta-oligomannan phosphorylase